MNIRLRLMEQRVAPTIAYADELKMLQNQRECMRAAAEVVSSASTIAGSDGRASTNAPSDFNDVLPPNPSEPMLRWFGEAVPSVYEHSDEAAESAYGNVNAYDAPGVVDGGDIASVAFSTHMVEDSDSDGEMEAEIVQLQLAKGETELQSGNFEAAEIMLRNGWSRLTQHRSRHFGTDLKLSVLKALLDIYKQQGKWEKAKEVIMDRLTILSGHSFEKSGCYLDEAQSLADVLLRLGDTVQARVYAKKCIKAYREQGPAGYQGLERALDLMIAICQSENNPVDEEAFRLLLAHSKVQDPKLATEAFNISTLGEDSESSRQRELGSGCQVQALQSHPYLDDLSDPYEMPWDGKPHSLTSDDWGKAVTRDLIETQTHLMVPFESCTSAEQRPSTPQNNDPVIMACSSLQNGVRADPKQDLDCQTGRNVALCQAISLSNADVSDPAEFVRGHDPRSSVSIVQGPADCLSPKLAAVSVHKPHFNNYDGYPVIKDEASCQMLSSDSISRQQSKTRQDDEAMDQFLERFQERVSLDSYYKIAETEGPPRGFNDKGADIQHHGGANQDRDMAQLAYEARKAICADIHAGGTRLASATLSPLAQSVYSSEEPGESQESEAERTESILESSVSA